MPGPERLWLNGPLGILYMPMLVVLTGLWYRVFTLVITWLREKCYPAAMTRDAIFLAVLMAVTPGVWRGLFWRVIGAAGLAAVMTHGRRASVIMTDGTRVSVALSPPLRLKYCDRRSTAWSGAAAALITAIVLCVYVLRYFKEAADWPRSARVAALLIYTVLGAGAGLLRKGMRARWPEAVETGFVSARFGTSITKGHGFYVDELLMPLVFTPFVWAGMGAIDSVFFADILALGFAVIFAVPVFALWAFFHSGMLSWVGSLGRQQYMESMAYEVLLWDDHIQRWLGELTITGDPANNRYVLSGVLPSRATLTAIRRRLHDIHGAEVDADAVRIDPLLEPDYRRLTALQRRGTFGARRKAGGLFDQGA